MTAPQAAPKPASQAWAMQVQIPQEHLESVVQACFSGANDLTLRGPHTNVLLCALPKSASLHVTELLSAALGLRSHRVGYGLRGGRTYFPRLALAKYTGCSTISHCHNPGDAPTLKSIVQLGLRPIVLTRNFLDALVSRCDMSVEAPGSIGLLSPAAYQRFKTAPREEQLDVTIDQFAPTYLGFATSWFEHRGDPNLGAVYATFDELKRDEVGFVLRIASELGLPCTREQAESASRRIREAGGVHLSKTGKGRSGRGREQFTAEQMERLRNMARRFGCTDEAFLGFAPEPAAA